MSIEPITPPMSEHDARKITERIRGIVTSTRDAIEKMQRLLAEAKEGGAHIALGYGENEWTRYMADLFAEQPLRLPRDQRQELVGFLAGEGMSVRAIAGLTGSAKSQIHRDVEQVSQKGHLTPAVNTEAEEVSDDFLPDNDVEEEAPSAEAEATTGSADPVAEDVETGAPGEEVEPTPAAPSRSDTVTSLDGKQHPRQKQSKPKRGPKRKPLTDAFTAKRWEMQKALESLSTLTADDRFPQNAEKVATANRSDLLRIKDQLQLVIEQLPEYI